MTINPLTIFRLVKEISFNSRATNIALIFLLSSCVAIEGKEINLEDFPKAVLAKNTNLKYELMQSTAGLGYDVVIKNDVPVVLVNTRKGESVQSVENRIFSYGMRRNTILASKTMFQQNTEYKTKNFHKKYKTGVFRDYIYALSLSAKIADTLEKKGVKKSFDDKEKGGCSARVYSSYSGSESSGTCSISEFSIISLYLIPYYCPVSYHAQVRLLDKESNILKEYKLKETASRMAWMPFLFGKDAKHQALNSLNNADYSAQNKISEAISRRLIHDANKFKECQDGQK
jgi:hypothetical protein